MTSNPIHQAIVELTSTIEDLRDRRDAINNPQDPNAQALHAEILHLQTRRKQLANLEGFLVSRRKAVIIALQRLTAEEKARSSLLFPILAETLVRLTGEVNVDAPEQPAPQPVPRSVAEADTADGAVAAATAAGATTGEPPWFQIAKAELGVKELPGAEDNPRILAYLRSVPGVDPSRPIAGETGDEIPWCSAFVNFCVKAAGLTGTDNLLARSWEHWGSAVPQDKVRIGDVAVFWRVSQSSGKGHVGFFAGPDGSKIDLLGGNQSNSVSIAPYPKPKMGLIGFRRPEPQ